MAVDTETEHVADDSPTPAFRRQYLRSGLPGVYREGLGRDETEPFAMRFVGALEGVLDPIVAMLDLLPAHFDLTIAPADVVDLVGAWLGLEIEHSLPIEDRRALVLAATAITRARGTLSGIRNVLALAFPDIGIEVHDTGGVTHGDAPPTPPPALGPMLVVVYPPSVPEPKRAAIRRTVEELKPVHVQLEIVVRETGVRA